MDGVWRCGPEERTATLVMLAIADNADDFGFGCPGQALIARKARCDERTVIRVIAQLEQEGWLRVVRKIVNGKSNAYLLNLGKIGVTLSPDSERSPLHSSLRRRHPDMMSSIFFEQNSGDTKEFSADIPQAPQVTNAASQVTKTAVQVTPDVTLTHNPQVEPSTEPSPNVEGIPLPPSGASSVSAEITAPTDDEHNRFEIIRQDLREVLKQVRPASVDARFDQVVRGVNDFDACFSAWWLIGIRRTPAAIALVTQAESPDTTKRGIDKYRMRLDAAVKKYFKVLPGQRIEFRIRELSTQQNPAA